MPVTDTATSAPSRARAPSAMATATSADTAPWVAIRAAGTASCRFLRLVCVRDDSAHEDVARPGYIGKAAGDQPSRARLRGRERQAARAACLDHELLNAALVAAEQVLASALSRALEIESARASAPGETM